MDKSSIDALWVLVCAGFVFLMQAGFMCLESGMTRSKNAINVAAKNLCDLALSFLVFWAVGYGFLYGDSVGGVIGGSNFFAPIESMTVHQAAVFVFLAMFSGTVSTIVSGAVSERIRFSVYMIMSLLVAGLIFPVVGHWVWHADGWLATAGYVDFAGSAVVHCAGGMVALAAVLILGPRKGVFDTGSVVRPTGSSLPLAMLGTLILWFGWIGFNGGSTLALNNQIGVIVANTFLAGASALVTTLIVVRMTKGYYDLEAIMCGSLGGLVAITGGCHAVTPALAIFIGVVAAFFVSYVTTLLEKHKSMTPSEPFLSTPELEFGALWQWDVLARWRYSILD